MTDKQKKSHEVLKANTSTENFADKPLRDKIGNNLKQLYDEVVNEDVPDDFLAILAKADTRNK